LKDFREAISIGVSRHDRDLNAGIKAEGKCFEGDAVH
jgi:hypothetical protein